jgi:H/ACA ribonucleoprotein complex subunit 1
VCRLTHTMIPYFNAGIYLQNKSKVGRVEEVFGPINKVYFTIKPDMGVNPTSFRVEDKVYIGVDKLLPLTRFLNEGKGSGRSGGRVGGRGGAGRGGRTAGRGRSGFPSPGGRAGFSPGGRSGFSSGRGRTAFGRGSGGGRSFGKPHG